MVIFWLSFVFCFFFFSRQTCINFCEERKWAYLVLEKGNRWWCWPPLLCLWALLCRSVSPSLLFLYPRVAFLSVSISCISYCVISSPPLLFFTFSLSRFSFLSYTALSLFSPPVFDSSSGFYSQKMQAFFVTADMHHGGEGCQPRDVPPNWKCLHCRC